MWISHSGGPTPHGRKSLPEKSFGLVDSKKGRCLFDGAFSSCPALKAKCGELPSAQTARHGCLYYPCLVGCASCRQKQQRRRPPQQQHLLLLLLLTHSKSTAALRSSLNRTPWWRTFHCTMSPMLINLLFNRIQPSGRQVAVTRPVVWPDSKAQDAGSEGQQMGSDSSRTLEQNQQLDHSRSGDPVQNQHR